MHFEPAVDAVAEAGSGPQSPPPWLVGADGATHAGSFDIAYLGCLPGMVVMASADEAELMNMVATAVAYDEGPIAFRYPRGNGTGVPLQYWLQTEAPALVYVPPGGASVTSSAKNLKLLNNGAAEVAKSVSGHIDDNTAPLMGAEDFSFMLLERPGAYIFVGNGDTAMVHHPAYNFDDNVIPFGSSWYAGMVETRMPAA